MGGTSMHSIYQEQLNFSEQYHYFCVKNCAYQLLINRGWKEKEIHQTLNLDFQLRIAVKNMQFLVEQKNVVEPFSDEKICIKKKGETFSNSLIQCLDMLNRGNAIIAIVDTFFLPYRIEYQRNHAKHSVIIAGISNDNIYLIDWYPPHYFKGAISLAEWKKAWESENPLDNNPFSGTPIHNEWFTIDFKLCEVEKDNLCKQNWYSMLESNATCKSINLLQKILKYNVVALEKEKLRLFHDALFLHYRSSIQALHFLQSFELGEAFQMDVHLILNDMIKILGDINSLFLMASIKKKEERILKICNHLEQYKVKRIELSNIIKSMDNTL